MLTYLNAHAYIPTHLDTCTFVQVPTYVTQG